MGAQDILAAIGAALVSFTGGAPQADDVTLVVCKRTG
jgi:serine phosphatase RsbU (regulator of sigma subunit)